MVELISDYPCMSTAEESFMESIADDLADHLLANGVIVPPCKLGDTVYIITSIAPDCVSKTKVVGLAIRKDGIRIQTSYDYPAIHELGIGVFASKNEAEQKLYALLRERLKFQENSSQEKKQKRS